MNRQQRPQLIQYDWKSVNSMEDLGVAVSFYLENKALVTSGRPNSLWKESEVLVPNLLEMNKKNFVTLSSQPGIGEGKTLQRFYVTGLLANDLYEEFVQNLHMKGFVTLVNNPENTCIDIPPETSLSPPIDEEAATNIPDDVLPLTLMQQGKKWMCVNSVPLPLPLAEIQDLNVILDVNDGGEVLGHHIESNFGKLLKKDVLQNLWDNAVGVTAVWPFFGGDMDEIKKWVVECIPVKVPFSAEE